jgi:hypothetical protein
MSLNFWKAQAKAVYPDLRFTTETLAALSPSREDIQQIPSTATIVAETQVMIYLPATQAVTLKRNNISTSITTNNIMLNPGDILTLSAAAAMVAIPV